MRWVCTAAPGQCEPQHSRAHSPSQRTCTMQQGSFRLFTSLPSSCFFLSFASNLVSTCLLPANEGACWQGVPEAGTQMT